LLQTSTSRVAEGGAETIDQCVESRRDLFGVHRRKLIYAWLRQRLRDSLEGGLQPVGRCFRIVCIAGHAPALPHVPHELKAGAVLNVKQITAHGDGWPAVVVHGLADVRLVLAPGRPVTLLSAKGAALYAGCAWWRALVEQARAAHPGIPIDDILDCADAPGYALGALRIGQRRIVLDAAAAGWSAVAAVAASQGGEVLTSRPPALDMAERRAARLLHDWLRTRTTPGDSGGALV